MADYTFPATLPKPLQSGFSRTEQSYVTETQPAAGTPYIRVRADDAAMSFKVVFNFSQAQMAELETWLQADNNAVANGATFDFDIITDNGFEIQEAIFAPNGLPRIDSVTANRYVVSADIIARSYSENIMAASFQTPKNEFSYYFYSLYQYPDILPDPLEVGYSKSDASRFDINSLNSGLYAKQLVSDDAPTTYNLQFTFTQEEAAIFRAWLAQDEFNMLKGAAFNIRLLTEFGMTIQVVRFTEGGYPQLISTNAHTINYSAQVIARKQMDDPNGLTDAVFGPNIVASLLYPLFFTESVSGGASFGGGQLEEVIKNYAYTEQVIGAAVFSGGALEEIVKNYAYTEQVNGGATFGGGAFISIYYDNYAPEQVNGTATFAGGSFPSLHYGNWPAEQLNGTATFAGGTLG